MRLTTAITAPATSLAVLFAVVACGPAKTSTSIAKETPTAVMLAAKACKDGLRPSLDTVIGDGKLAVPVCQAVTGTDGKEKLSLIQVPVSYRIVKANASTNSDSNPVEESDDDSSAPANTKPVSNAAPAVPAPSVQAPTPVNSNIVAIVSINLHLVTSVKLTDQEAAGLQARFQADCVANTAQIFERSSLKNFGLLSFQANIKLTSYEDLATIPASEPIITLIRQEDATGVYFTMQHAPKERLYIGNQKTNAATCSDALKADLPNAEEICAKAQDSNRKINFGFCARFAKKSVAWLGLTDSTQEAVKCAAPAAAPATPVTTAPAAEGKAQPAGVAAPISTPSSFVKPTVTKAEDYFATAKLSEKDIVTLLKPVAACASLADLSK